MIVGGMKVIIDNHVRDYDLVKRTWKERLFTWPWKPFKKYNSVFNPKYYKFGNENILCSPQGYEILKRELKDTP